MNFLPDLVNYMHFNISKVWKIYLKEETNKRQTKIWNLKNADKNMNPKKCREILFICLLDNALNL